VVTETVRSAARLVAALEEALVDGHDAVRHALVALLAGGHVLIEDVPGCRQDDARPGP
jgi:MoxR-like ATPase